MDTKINLKESLKKLNGIVSWFEGQEEVDVEEGLEKIKQGASLIKACKARLSEIENEFEKVRKDIEEDGSTTEQDGLEN